MGKTRDLFKNIRDTKGRIHAKMVSIKDRNSMDLIEAEEIKKKWQEYAEELHKKGLNDSDNHNGVVTHLEPDILQCEVKWALGSIAMNKASRNDRIPAKLFTVLKDDVAFNMPANLENWPQDWKKSVFIPITKKGNANVCSNYCILHSFHMLAK